MHVFRFEHFVQHQPTIAVVLDRDGPAAPHIISERVPFARPGSELQTVVVKSNTRYLHILTCVVPVEPRCRPDVLRLQETTKTA